MTPREQCFQLPAQPSVRVYASFLLYWRVTQCWEVSVLSRARSLGYTCHQFLISCHKEHRSVYPGIGGKKRYILNRIHDYVTEVGHSCMKKDLGKIYCGARILYTDKCEINQATCWEVSNWLSTFSISMRTIHFFFYSSLILKPAHWKHPNYQLKGCFVSLIHFPHLALIQSQRGCVIWALFWHICWCFDSTQTGGEWNYNYGA